MKRIRIRGGTDWKNEAKTLCIAVSMNASNCEGEEFIAALRFAQNEETAFFVDVSDTLQVPNLIAEGASPFEARAKARAMGNQWLLQHQPFLRGEIIIRWSFWEEQPDFEEIRHQFYWLFYHNDIFNKIVAEDVKTFTSRKPDRQTESFSKASVDFILNECTGKTLQGQIFPGLAVLYPGHELKSLSALRAGKIAHAPKGIEKTHYLRYTLESCHEGPRAFNQEHLCRIAS